MFITLTLISHLTQEYHFMASERSIMTKMNCFTAEVGVPRKFAWGSGVQEK